MKKNIFLLLACLLAIALVVFAFSGDRLVPQGIMGAGVTNLTNLELAGTLDVAGNTDLVGTLNYGANNLYPIGYVSSGQHVLLIAQDTTGSETVVTTPLTAIVWAMCTMCDDPTAAGSTGAYCTVSITTNVVTGNVWQDDGVTISDEADVCVNYIVSGTP